MDINGDGLQDVIQLILIINGHASGSTQGQSLKHFSDPIDPKRNKGIGQTDSYSFSVNASGNIPLMTIWIFGLKME